MTHDFMGWLRSMFNLTQRELADRMGISVSYVKKLEGGVKPLNRSIQRKLTKAFGIQEDDFQRFRNLFDETMTLKQSLA